MLARHPNSAYESPSTALSAVWTDSSWACPVLEVDRTLGASVPTYAFEFADENAPWASDGPAPSFPTGAFHAAEVQYLFDDEQFAGPLTAAQQHLSDQMIRYWTRFAHTGDPNGDGTPAWPRFDATSDRVQALAPGAAGIRGARLGAEHRCGFWRSLAR